MECLFMYDLNEFIKDDWKTKRYTGIPITDMISKQLFKNNIPFVMGYQIMECIV